MAGSASRSRTSDALAAAEVADAPGARRADGREHGAAALLAERRRLVGLGHDPRAFQRVVQVFRLGVVHLGQPRERVPGELPLVRQVAAGDQLLLRVAGQPVAARADQLVHLVGGHPVVLAVVEDRQQHVEVVERVGQPHRAGQPDVQVARLAPVRNRRVERHRGRRDLPAQRLEHPPREVDPAPAGQRRDVQLKRQGRVGQLLVARAAAGERGAEHLLDRDREHARCRVRTVVHVLAKREALAGRPVTAADETHRIDLEQQRRRRPPLPDLRVEHVRRAHGHVERLHPAGMLMQQESQVGRGFGGRRNRQQHNPSLCPIPPRASSHFPHSEQLAGRVPPHRERLAGPRRNVTPVSVVHRRPPAPGDPGI